jgi:23S rRNA pseudouridine1911/1915/1917 synthase
MGSIEFQWLYDQVSLKEGLQECLGSSGQLLKKHFSSKELARPLKAHDLIRLPLDLVNHLQINPSYEGSRAVILHETDDFIAVHKPAAIHSHPLCYSDKNTVLNFLAAQGKWEALRVNKSSYDRGLLFRLDFETSGVLVLAKTESFFGQIRNNFQKAIKRKLYWTIVEGEFNQEGEWTHYFRASGVKGAKQKVSLDSHESAQEGSLSVRKILSSQGKSLLLVNLDSGLRHQIRAQLSSLGFPILGDELYGGAKSSRLFLHAWRYEWDEMIEDPHADLFESFFNLDRALQVSHDMLGII